tara:strand:- start:1918 stop:2709 length:792 start_codon:yes stop_codon:yes gene_type:complete
MKNRIGILQGRLSNAPKGRLQYFPKNWIKEFPIAYSIGFNYIEFFSERAFNIKNPIWNLKELKNLKKHYIQNNLQFYSFIDDYILKKKIDKKLLSYYKKLIKSLVFLKIKLLTVPLYGKNKINNKNLEKVAKFLNKISKICRKNNIKLSIESNIDYELFCILKSKIKNGIYLTLDTGNRILLDRDLYKDIKYFNKSIAHIHIKDKNIKKKNVTLGCGKVNFLKLFKNLKLINYKGSLTLETNRYEKPILFAKKNYKYIKKYLN